MSRNNQGPHGFDGFSAGGQGAGPDLESNIHALDERRLPPVSSRPSNVQVVLWSLLGVGAVGYLGLSLFAGPLLQPAALPADAGTQRLEQTFAEMTTLSQEVTAIGDRIASQDDVIRASKQRTEESALMVDDMRRQVASLNNSARALEERVQALEAGKGGKSAKAPVAVQPQAAQSVAVQPDAIDPGIDGLVIDEPAPVKSKKVAAAPAVAEEPTSLVPKPKPAQVAKQKPMGIELAMSTSPEALRLSWELLNEQHGAALSGLQPKSAPSGDNFRLLAGPFASAEQATAACAKLLKSGLACKPTAYVGTSLQ